MNEEEHAGFLDHIMVKNTYYQIYGQNLEVVRIFGVDFGWNKLLKYDDYYKYIRFSDSEFKMFKKIIAFNDKNIKSNIVDRW